LRYNNYGDEYEDQVAIRIGYEYFKMGNLCEIVRRNAPDLKFVSKCCCPQKEKGIPPGIKKTIIW
jgi:hypothetical protein